MLFAINVVSLSLPLWVADDQDASDGAQVLANAAAMALLLVMARPRT